MKRLTNWRVLTLFSVMMLILSGCGKPFLSTLQPQGEVAKTQFDLMMLATIIMVFVVAVVSVLFIIAVVRYRERAGDKKVIPKQVEGNHKLEIIWTIIPILLLIILAVPTVNATFRLADTSPMEAETRDPNAVVVNVTAKLYWWEFEYPDYGIITSQDLVMPAGERVYFNLKAADVKHSFWVPSLGGKMDTNVDSVNKFYLKADEVGMFYGKCAELCGPSHSLMDFKVRAIPRDEFDEWAEKMANAKSVATTDLAKKGEQIYTEKGCIGCHAVNGAAGPGAGPSLANYGDRSRVAGIKQNNEENLKAWLKDPESIKPANLMTGKYPELSNEEIDALTEYLMGLKVMDLGEEIEQVE
ncbi:cytochrome c oxidase subunit II [Bacillus sp. HMF5848]|uniref:cytochrome c oxidase subunit II n=1 Tax=Bacillus sp. HMF5848 TaxID=2495421 RepID=UPI000F7887DB|nr:cytochrome c oxidase subunit II [Bacillus sp. HMF5848]RSK26899.1 cytochrome c oxidase subunit II [Bacillus sp. HMF5848]